MDFSKLSKLNPTLDVKTSGVEEVANAWAASTGVTFGALVALAPIPTRFRVVGAVTAAAGAAAITSRLVRLLDGKVSSSK